MYRINFRIHLFCNIREHMISHYNILCISAVVTINSNIVIIMILKVAFHSNLKSNYYCANNGKKI